MSLSIPRGSRSCRIRKAQTCLCSWPSDQGRGRVWP
jgi:hypothetical protein